MSKREEMLERIRKALGRPPGSPPPVSPVRPNQAELGSVLSPIPPEELIPRFEAELDKVAGCPHRAVTMQELDATLRSIFENSGATSAVLSRHPLLGELDLENRLRAWGLTTSVWPGTPGQDVGADAAQQFREHALSAAVGITGVDFVLAESGSLVLSSVTEGSQLVSLAPPVHVALYRRAQVFGSLEDILERLPVSHDLESPSPGRSLVFITGPSRTADIEQILIRGVHGPREVHAILIEESCLR